MTTDRQDVVIVGGGVMGCSVAYHLKLLAPELGVLVIERDPRYVAASSALSASSIRQQFSSPVNIALSQYGFRFLSEAGDRLAVTGERPDVGLVERGYLYLATAAGAESLRELNALQRGCGADVALLAPDALAARFPWLATHDLALGSLGLHGEGWFDGYALLQALRRKAKALGAGFLHAEVTGLEMSAGRVAAVDCGDGRRIACGELVNAAGPQAGHVARLAGVELPVVPMRHGVFVFECRDALADVPLVIDPCGLWFRPEGARRFLVGAPPRDPASPDNATLEVDHAQFDDELWPALAHRVPAFEAIRRTSAWAGFYEMNTFDHNAIIGRVPDVANLLLINGFSGHGLQQAPAAGLALAEILVHGAAGTIDVSPLAFDRIAAGRPVRERNVI
ncbi:MAG: FAD-binding oxidoreductase [Betaproteobacteria bacterium]